MSEILSQETLREMASRWVQPSKLPDRFRVHEDTTDFFRVEYDDIVMLGGSPFLIRNSLKEQRFGLDDEIKFWVKRAIDLRDGSPKIIKLVFYEKFLSHIGDIEFECYRSPKKEARILELVSGHRNFMHGCSVKDAKGNIIRVLDIIKGPVISRAVINQNMDHESYYHQQLPKILRQFMASIEAIRFLHEHGEKHGDIHPDHILIDRDTGDYRWIDFDFNYRHRENIYGYDLFGLGNVLAFIVGKGDILTRDLPELYPHALNSVKEADLNIVFNNRIMNLRKVYSYISPDLNRVLMHFSKGANIFYEHTTQLLTDLGEALEAHT